MDQLTDLVSVFGAVGALAIVACAALWRAWHKEREGRASDWAQFNHELRKAHQEVVDQMELRLKSQGIIVEKCSEMTKTVGELSNAISRIEGAVAVIPRS